MLDYCAKVQVCVFLITLYIIFQLPWWLSSLKKNPPEMQETWVQSLGPQDPLAKEMAAHSSILA